MPDGRTPSEQYAALVRADGPVAYFRCNDLEGATEAVDDRGGAPATFGKDGPSITLAGLFPGSRACEFRGGDDDLATVASMPFYGDGDYSLEAWAWFAEGPDDVWRHLFQHSMGGDENSHAYGVFLHAGNGLTSERLADNFNTYRTVTEFPTLSAWHHVVAVSNAGVWVDGAHVSNEPVTKSDHPGGAQHFSFGSKTGQAAMKGRLAEVAVYALVLSEDRIQAHYQAGKP